ncbi:Phospholipase A I [Fusarium oxysporum f. sp. raphani]|uniref:Phospholipase A I n=1 Tax=Fusarium oxysporum f. sp. raphani TaxID=96318 RepID=A0A8J5PTP4_FUSOX|nr:Phospholipase A I [Fusarium oxysporum f. sp. raphani]
MTFHQDRSGHEPQIEPQKQKAVKWTLGRIGKWVELTTDKLFLQDESTKWFGLWRDPRDKLLWLVETPRIEQLLLESRQRSGLTRNFPRLVTFVGQTDVGKSTIIRGLMSARSGEDWVGDESPVPAPADSNPCTSTTGEVNLYADPATLESKNPILYVDCEGFSGTGTLAAKYQSRWYSRDIRYRDYRIDESSTHATTRTHVAKQIYPRFLYIFSDVICFVVEQTRLIRDAVISLLKWSQICSSHVVNQFSIPSAILIINNWDPAKWNSSKPNGHQTLKEEVFLEMEQERRREAPDPFLEELMRKCNASTVQDLISRRYSSFEICFIPRTHYNGMTLSSPTEVMGSFEKLGHCIDHHSNSVSDQRQHTWARLDSGQLQWFFCLAFKHLASGRPGAFDFGKSLQSMELPSSASDHLSRFLDLLLSKDVENRFGFTARAIAESLSIEAIANPKLVPLPDSILNEELRGKIDTAAEKFLSQSLQCAFIGQEGTRCVNTRNGHIRGHQTLEGNDLGNGDFDAAEFTPRKLLEAVAKRVRELISEVNTKPASQRRNWLVTEHLLTLTRAHKMKLLPATTQVSEGRLVKLSSVCFGCLIRKPEYRLPCNHHICATCVERFQEQDHSLSFFHVALHKKCFICGSTEPLGSWSISVALQPPLAGVRALSLDGGGTRGMMELEILRRLEQKIGLGIPVAKFFDLIIGTNAGGFIAIGLGVHGWEIETASSKFSQLVNGGLVFQKTPPWSRATWASPYYFEPFQGSNDTDRLFDGGLFHNNPAGLVFDEKRHIWPGNVNLDVILSLGSGSNLKPEEPPHIHSSQIENWVQKREKDYFKPIPDTQETKEHAHKDTE